MEIVEIIKSVPWQPSIGDATWLGWLTAIVYLIAALTCALCAWRADKIFGVEHVGQHRLIWSGLAALLLFLGFNKQLDLQNWFTAVIKTVAYHQGWYVLGQWAQIVFVAGLALLSLTMILVLAWWMRKVWRHYTPGIGAFGYPYLGDSPVAVAALVDAGRYRVFVGLCPRPSGILAPY